MLVIAFCYFSFEQPASLDEEDFRFSHQDLYVANLEYDLTRHFMQITTILQQKNMLQSVQISAMRLSVKIPTMVNQKNKQTNKQSSFRTSVTRDSMFHVLFPSVSRRKLSAVPWLKKENNATKLKRSGG